MENDEEVIEIDELEQETPEEVEDDQPIVEEPEVVEEEEIDWQERALKAEKVIEDRKRKEKEAKKVNPPAPNPQPQNANPVGDMDAVLARLENRGVMESEDQQYVLRFAKSEGISPVEALQDEVVKDKLAFLKKQRETKAATQTPGNRTGTSGGKSVDWYINKGEIPRDPVMAEKVQNEIARRSRESA